MRLTVPTFPTLKKIWEELKASGDARAALDAELDAVMSPEERNLLNGWTIPLVAGAAAPFGRCPVDMADINRRLAERRAGMGLNA